MTAATAVSKRLLEATRGDVGLDGITFRRAPTPCVARVGSLLRDACSSGFRGRRGRHESPRPAPGEPPSRSVGRLVVQLPWIAW
jgi:hypothetical protein